MSFLNILKKIGTTALGIEHVAAPILSMIPGIGPVMSTVDGIVTHIQQGILTAEANNITDGAGVVKAASVTADFQSAVAVAQDIAGLEGKQLVWDAAALQAAISAQVAAYNAFSALKTSFKIVDLPK